jgi:hypothetical protein
MSNNSDYFLKKMLGEDFVEVLSKTEIYKPGTRTVVDTSDIHLGLKLVPRVIMSLLIKELSSMNIGEHRNIDLPIEGEAKLCVDKVEHDCFNGRIEQNNKKIAEFLDRSIPGIGLYILSTFELYDIERLNDKTELDSNKQIQQMIEERLSLHDLVNKVVDKKILERDAVHEMLLSKLTIALEKEKNNHEQTRVQLAGCGVAAYGYATGKNDAKPGDYGHSASFDDVKRLYNEHDKVRKDIENVNSIQKDCLDGSEYMRGMANGLEVANSIANKKEPKFVESPKKGSPLKDFLEKREQKIKKNEHTVYLSKGESVCCPDCGKEIFDGDEINPCICYGDCGKIFIRKTENGEIKVKFSKNWDIENIEMLLEILRKDK